MATKKNLSDLLQEEAQKFTPQVGDTAIEVTAKTIVEDHSSSDEEETTSTPSKRTNPTKADLEVTIKELTATLEKAHKNEFALKEEISHLTTDLSAQTSLSERLTTELNETKKAALQLAESNSQLIAEIKELKQATQVKENLPAPIKETVKDTSKSLSINPKKSHRSPARLQELPNQTNDDFANNTWLYD
jgi:DNA repair exonuclease SbcCD ATPase subunit